MMPTDSIQVSARFPVSPERLFRAWLDSQEHTRFTGGVARIDPTIGGSFSVWDDYITGRTLELDPGRRLVQAWRSTDFPEEAPDSQIELRFEPENGGTRLTIDHTGIPEGQGDRCEEGWVAYYFEPMQRYFKRLSGGGAAEEDEGTAARPARAAVPARRTRPAAKKAAAKKKAAARGGRKTARKAAKRPARKAARRPARKAAKRPARKAARRPARKVARKVARRPARKKARAAARGRGARRTTRGAKKTARRTAGRRPARRKSVRRGRR